MSKPPTFKPPVGQISRKQPGGPNFRLAVLAFLVLHAMFFAGLLLQGCRPKTDENREPAPTNGLPNLSDLWNGDTTPAPPPVPPAPTNPPPSTPGNATAPGTGLTPPATNPIPDLTVTNPPPTPRPPIDTNPPPSQPPSAPPGTTPDQSEDLAKAREHVVASGETMWGIARQYGITLRELEAANPDVVPDKLQIGATLTIPAPKPRAAAPAEEPYEGTIYTIQRGDTLSSIARKFGVGVKAISEANNLRSTRIYAGKKLKIPKKPGNGGN